MGLVQVPPPGGALPGAGFCLRRTGPCAGALSGAHPWTGLCLGGLCFAGRAGRCGVGGGICVKTCVKVGLF